MARLTIKDVVRETAAHFGLTDMELLGGRRLRRVAWPRFVAYHLCLQMGRTYSETGRRLGGRDHTTIIHGVRRLAELRQENPNLEEGIAAIGARLVALEIGEAA